MLENTKNKLHHILNAPAGKRFLQFHENHQKNTYKRKRIFTVLIGIALILFGVFSSLLPGVPGVVFVILGFGLIAIASKALAKFLDKMKLHGLTPVVSQSNASFACPRSSFSW